MVGPYLENVTYRNCAEKTKNFKPFIKMRNFKMRYFYLIIGLYTSMTTLLFAVSYKLEAPQGWECINDPKQLPAKVKVVYVGSGKWQLTPSINLAVEESSRTIDEYLEEAKAYHEKSAATKVTKLGIVKTKAGEAKVLQIDRATNWGNVRFIQATLMVNKNAYVITATCLQEEFGQVSRAIFQTIQSFTLNFEEID